MGGMFFDDWQGLVRPLVVGALAYLGLVVFLRISGKRTLAKMDAFDLFVTVAMGSTLATVLLTWQVPLLDALVGFATLIVLQFVVTWLSVRSAAVRRLVRAEPTLMYYRGEFVDRSLRANRVTESEIYQAVRAHGFGDMDGVEAVVLETDGSFSVVTGGSGSNAALAAVDGVERHLPSRITAHAARSPRR